MIDVNLVGSSRTSAVSGRRTNRTAWTGLAALVLTAIGSGIGWWSVRAEVTRLDRELAFLDGEARQLRPSAREAELALARKTALTERLALLDREQETRLAPVRILEAVGQSLPADVWLTTIQQRGARLEIDGQALSLQAITDFAGRIQRAGVVTTPVEVLSTSSESREGITLVRFSLRVD